MMSWQDELTALARSVSGLCELPPVDRAKQARALSDEAKRVLSSVGDVAVVEALATATYEQVAQALEVSSASVNKAVTRHRARLRSSSVAS